MIKKAITLLENGSIMGKCFQPHEAHLPYILQFMIDYNLHGMSLIKLSDIKFRIDPENQNISFSPELYLPNHISRMSVCELEGDVSAEHILNRLEVKQGELGSNPGIVSLWEDEKQRRRNKNMNSQISQCLSQTKRDCAVTASHVLLKQALKERLATLSENLQSGEVDKNASVYPAETPDSCEDIMNASYIDQHTSQRSDVTLVNDQTLNDSSMFEVENENLIDLLCHMAGKEEVEEGSALSQIVKDPQESDGDEEADLSLPLFNDSFGDFNIPQLDGNTDVEIKMRKRLVNQSKYIPMRGLDMPELGEVENSCEISIPDGKSSEFKLKNRSLPVTTNSNQKAQETVKKRCKSVKKSHRLDFLKMIKEIKNHCTLRRIESFKKVRFRVVPFARLQPQTAKVSFATLNGSCDYNVMVSSNSKQFSQEEIVRSPGFLLLQAEYNRLAKSQSEQQKKKNPLDNVDLSKIHSCCCRPNCSILKRCVRQIIDDCGEINYDQLRVMFEDFSCSVQNLFNIKPKARKKRRTAAQSSPVHSDSDKLHLEKSATTSEAKEVSKLCSSSRLCCQRSELVVNKDSNSSINNQNRSSEQRNLAGDSIDFRKEVYLEERRYTNIYKKLAKRQLRALDGPNDSSSSDEEVEDVKSDASKNKQMASYTPLFIDNSPNLG